MSFGGRCMIKVLMILSYVGISIMSGISITRWCFYQYRGVRIRYWYSYQTLVFLPMWYIYHCSGYSYHREANI